MFLLESLIYLLFIILILTSLTASLYLIWFIIELTIEDAKEDIKLRNNITSCLYFFMDMGPNISSVAVIAIIIEPDGVTTFQLIIVFIFGIMLKRIGRKIKELFYKKLDINYSKFPKAQKAEK